MTPELLEQLKYPIGEFKTPKVINSKQIAHWIGDIADFPAALVKETDG